MKTKEYFRLAYLNLKSRRKSARATVRGLAIGFIILIPLIVVLAGLNISITKQLNKVPYVLFGKVSMSDYRVETSNDVQNGTIHNLSGSKNINFFMENELLKSKIVYELHSLKSKVSYTQEDTVWYSIDNSTLKALRDKSGDYENYYSVIDIGKSQNLFPQNLVKNFPDGIFVEGCDQGFTNNEKKQVIVAEKFLTLQRLKPKDVYKKKITLVKAFTLNYQEETCYLCKDYEVVGVIKSEVSKIYSYGVSYDQYAYMNSDMFFTDVNVYKDGEGVLKPRYEENSKGWRSKIYDNWEKRNEYNQEYMMLGREVFNNKNNTTIFSTNIYFESSSYANLKKAADSVDSYIKKTLCEEADALDMSAPYIKYYYTYKEINIASFVFGIVGSTIALCAIINLFSSIKSNVEERKFYLTMMRAIGARDRAIPNLYIAESAIVITKANIFLAVIGFLISYGLKILIGRLMEIKNISVNLGIPWSVIAICVSVTVVALYALGFLFAYICSYRLSKKPIINVLKNY